MKNVLNLTWLFERRFMSECDLILKIYQSGLNKEKLLKYLKLHSLFLPIAFLKFSVKAFEPVA